MSPRVEKLAAWPTVNLSLGSPPPRPDSLPPLAASSPCRHPTYSLFQLINVVQNRHKAADDEGRLQTLLVLAAAAVGAIVPLAIPGATYLRHRHALLCPTPTPHLLSVQTYSLHAQRQGAPPLHPASLCRALLLPAARILLVLPPSIRRSDVGTALLLNREPRSGLAGAIRSLLVILSGGSKAALYAHGSIRAFLLVAYQAAYLRSLTPLSGPNAPQPPNSSYL